MAMANEARDFAGGKIAPGAPIFEGAERGCLFLRVTDDAIW